MSPLATTPRSSPALQGRDIRDIARPHAFFSADVLLALAVLVILTVALTVAATRQQRASQRLAETRAAARLAEATIIALQTGQSPPAAPAGATVRIQPLDTQSDLPPNCTWATVTVTVHGKTSELSAVVRRDALKAEAP